MAALAERRGTQIAGGDVVSGPALYVSVAVTGWAEAEERLVYRSGARPGDIVGMTGSVGGSGAGLLLLRGASTDLDAAERDALVRRHLRPEPLLIAGRELADAGVHAMIDVSDGVATDGGHLAASSGVELELRLVDLPLAPGVDAVARAAGQDPHEFAATAGDDYELLFTVAPDRREAVEALGLGVSWLGDVRPGSGLVIRRADGAVATLAGYEHA
jgi:thiamine-monophosphate kinase